MSVCVCLSFAFDHLYNSRVWRHVMCGFEPIAIQKSCNLLPIICFVFFKRENQQQQPKKKWKVVKYCLAGLAHYQPRPFGQLWNGNESYNTNQGTHTRDVGRRRCSWRHLYTFQKIKREREKGDPDPESSWSVSPRNSLQQWIRIDAFHMFTQKSNRLTIQ